MKLSLMFLIIGMLQVSASVYSQNGKFNVQIEDVELADLFWELQESSDVVFIYKSSDLVGFDKVSITKNNASVEEILDEVLEGKNLEYSIDDDVVIIKRKLIKEENSAKGDAQQQKTIKGKVTDENGNALPGVSVFIKGTYTGTSTNMNGIYEITVSEGAVLVFSFVGMESKEVLVETQTKINLVMKESATELDGIVVTGLGFSQKKETFTGATTKVDAQKIMSLNPKNIMQVLEIIDPEFSVVESNEFGSDPNRLQEIRLRGNSSLPKADDAGSLERAFEGDPNAPIFVVDGFQTSMREVFDIPPSRIESITLLKDAAATSFYGSVSLNGVVVIELKKPKAGELRINYRLMSSITAPDLSSYDLLNAEQKLELERIRGLHPFDDEYNGKQMNIAKGIDVDWINKPLRVGTNLNHSLGISGGSETFTYGISFNANPEHGVMKGSSRDKYSGNMTFTYRIKKFHFQNSMSYSETTAENSPYGVFSDYANMNPYLPAKDENGQLLYSIEPEGVNYQFMNPLWNASTDMFDRVKSSVITNNFSTRYKPFKFLILNAQISYSSTKSESEIFKPFDHTDFLSSSDNGSYSYDTNQKRTYMTRLGASFFYEINKHNFTLNTSVEYKNNKGVGTGFTAVDIPSGNLSHPIFAGKFKDNSTPRGESTISRHAGYLATLNYVFDHKLYADFTFRTDISSVFGDINPWAKFWSAGLGYNLEKEKFIKNIGFSQFRLKASIGNNGSQSFGPYQALKIYRTNTSTYYYNNGVGALLGGMGNRNLKWQTALNANVSADIGIFNNNLMFDFSYYRIKTKDAIVSRSLPGYQGFSSYFTNLGGVETEGYSFGINANLIRKRDLYLSVNLNANHSSEKMVDIGDAYENQNERLLSDKQTSPYNIVKEGTSTSVRYVRKSLGIDPMTGRELFMDENGNETFNYMDAEMMSFEENPDLKGSFGFSLRYKQLTISSSFQYQVGGEKFNSTVLNRVENIGSASFTNYDTRVFDDRWQKTGDIASFKNINDRETTYASSRFLQDASFLRYSSLNLTYRFKPESIKRYGLEGLSLSFTTNNLFYLQHVRLERGTSYPFARTFNFSVGINL
ncbi:SusC/RagA family TonB-linked outer membrane protein [Marinifilum sp.]|uniref:SusC/RagA family TonB-linked outer membrane protein n=1 Tax=Marinifilum sp. TaxID=2033137 RepID=UPI003BAD7B27